ncbi:MAG: VOC family protein [Deltaproteobacteria bacterium]|nr:VOC family protein [Deltaproteobacteria bacterium]
MPTITPFLWFDSQALEAAKFYVSVFKQGSKITSIAKTGGKGPGKKAAVMGVTFRLRGQQFRALNGGPVFHFTPAISMFVDCTTQREVDDLWKKLGRGGKPSRCGWLTDRYGLSWQIIPKQLGKLMHGTAPAKSAAVMKAMMAMDKIDIAGLERAYKSA